jgi:putative solute:sodium symporter small subunit
MPTDRAAVPVPPPPSGHAAPPSRERIVAARALHWRRARRLVAVLLGLWLATCFGTVFFARDLAHLSVFGWPLSFYLAAQGASLIFLAILGAYAWRMRVLDRVYRRMLEEGA